MIVCGCDVGSLTAKAVIMDGQEILAAEVMRSTVKPGEVARKVIDQALATAGLTRTDIKMSAGTGYGQERIPDTDELYSEIACHGKAAQWLLPSVRMIIDIGGQDAKAIKVDDKGDILKYVYNDACASGTGRFLEIMADALGVKLEDMGPLSLLAEKPLSLSSQCVVFAETEVITLVNDGYPLNDILGGLHQALIKRVASLARSVVLTEDITFTGGVAKNVGAFAALEQSLGVTLKKMDKIDPQVNGAVGAALLATERLNS